MNPLILGLVVAVTGIGSAALVQFGFAWAATVAIVAGLVVFIAGINDVG